MDEATGYEGAVPRTAEDIRRLLDARPPAWEYMFYGGALLEGLQALGPQYRDHERGTVPGPGRALSAEETMPFVSEQLNVAGSIVSRVERVLDPAVQEAAFGAPGEPGDPDRIRNLAARLISIYEELLEWSAVMRGTTVTPEFQEVFALGARMADTPIEEMRAFVDQYVKAVDAIPARLKTGQPVEITLALTMTEPDQLVAQVHAALARIEKIMTPPRRQNAGLALGGSFIFRKRKSVGGGRTVNLSKRGASVSQRLGPITLNSRGGGRIRIAPGLSFRFGKRR